MKKVLLLLLVLAFSGCGKDDSISKAANDAGMRPSEFQAAVDAGPAATLAARYEYQRHLKNWEQDESSGAWAESIEDGSYMDIIPNDYTGKPEDFPALRIEHLRKAIAKTDAVLDYLDKHID